MRIMNWYTGKSLSNFKWSIVGNPRLDWFSFGRFAGFYFEFLLVLNGMELSTDHVLVLAISLVLILQHFIEKRSIYLTL